MEAAKAGMSGGGYLTLYVHLYNFRLLSVSFSSCDVLDDMIKTYHHPLSLLLPNDFRAMLELNQILRANEINFPILATLPTFLLSLDVLMTQGHYAVPEVEKRIMQFQNCIDQGLVPDRQKDSSEPTGLFFYKPNLWWPNGMGKQQLHNAEITIEVDGYGESDAWNHHFWFRKIQSKIGSRTGGRLFKVNGEPIFIQDGNWILSDGLLRLFKTSSFMQDMNFTMTRCWGGGLAETCRTFIEKGPFGITATCLETFFKSCAGYSVIKCIFDIGDRHLDNLLLRDDGCLFHVDFCYVFGYDPKPLPPPMKLCKDMVEALQNGDDI
ncbi:mannosylglycoprotein endo-beta-mannosidase [Tanacetum coccineum]